MIPYGRQDIDQSDIDAVIEVLRSDFLTQGPTIPAFEKVVAQYCGAKHAVAVNSATSALHIACIALGVGKGDAVWTSPITFVASANCAHYCGAEVDFVDIDPRTFNMCVESLRAKLENAQKTGKLPKVVIPVHLCGQSCDMAAIHELSKKYGFRVIEDASHAIGGKYHGKPVGNCSCSDITVFSFHPVKIITTAEGGMAVTNDAKLAAHMARLRTHGITRNPAEMTGEPDGPWYYQQIGLGFNYRLTDMQAVLGLSQMKRLDKFVAARHAIAKRYRESFAGLPITVQHQPADVHSAFHLYVIRLQLSKIRKTHREVFEALLAAGIGVNLHYIPVYRQPYHARIEIQPARFPEAERYYSEAISIPMYAGLNEEAQHRVIEAIQKCL